MPNGSKSSWLCPDIIIGTILLKKRASIRTLPFIFRGLINFLGLTTILMSGRNFMVWTAKKLPMAFLGKRLNHLQKEKERFKNLVRLLKRPWVPLHPFSLPSLSQNISLV